MWRWADLALIKVADDGVVERFFELPLGLRRLIVQLKDTLLLWPLQTHHNIIIILYNSLNKIITFPQDNIAGS